MAIPVLSEKLFRARSDEHLSRKFFHLLSGTLVTFLYVSVFSRKQAVEWILVASAFLIFFDFIRLRSSAVNKLVLSIWGPVMREEEKCRPSGQLFYVLGLTWAIVFLPRVLAIQSILTLAWMDPIAGIFGLRFGRHPWMGLVSPFLVDNTKLRLDLGSKTMEGSFAGFLAAFLAGIIAWTGPWASAPGAQHLWWPSPLTVLLFSSLGALFAVIAEAWPSQWDDNINIPFWTGLLLWVAVTLLAVPVRYL